MNHNNAQRIETYEPVNSQWADSLDNLYVLPQQETRPQLTLKERARKLGAVLFALGALGVGVYGIHKYPEDESYTKSLNPPKQQGEHSYIDDNNSEWRTNPVANQISQGTEEK